LVQALQDEGTLIYCRTSARTSDGTVCMEAGAVACPKYGLPKSTLLLLWSFPLNLPPTVSSKFPSISPHRVGVEGTVLLLGERTARREERVAWAKDQGEIMERDEGAGVDSGDKEGNNDLFMTLEEVDNRMEIEGKKASPLTNQAEIR